MDRCELFLSILDHLIYLVVQHLVELVSNVRVSLILLHLFYMFVNYLYLRGLL
jgi:hypothetical protein